MNRLKILVLVLLFCIQFESVLAQQNLQKIVNRENYGVGIEKENGFYPVITFIPRTFLLFDIDFKEPDSKLGKKYLAATTQDGVRLYMLENAVSKSNFAQLFGPRHEIIFNTDYRVCLNPIGDLENDDDVLRIRSGEVFTAVEIGYGQIIQLTGNRGTKSNPDPFSGYISKAKLEQLNKKAIVTYASLPHPRYRVIKRKSLNLNTQCGKKIELNQEIPLDTIADVDRLIIDSLNLAHIRKNDDGLFIIKFEKEYGGEGKEIEYRVYEAFDQREKPERKETYIAQITYLCKDEVIDIRDRIEKVVLIMKETLQPIVLDTCSTPKDLSKHTQAPYLFSINNETHYFQIMDYLGRKFSNRAIAGYFLAEFNRSCKGSVRKTTKNFI